MGKFKDLDIERLDALENLHPSLTARETKLKNDSVEKHLKVKMRIKTDAENYFLKHQSPIGYRKLFHNLYSTLKGTMTPRQLAEEMQNEGLIVLVRIGERWNSPTWVFPSFEFTTLDLKLYEDLATDATIESLQRKQMRMSRTQKQIWRDRKKEETDDE